MACTAIWNIFFSFFFGGKEEVNRLTGPLFGQLNAPNARTRIWMHELNVYCWTLYYTVRRTLSRSNGTNERLSILSMCGGGRLNCLETGLFKHIICGHENRACAFFSRPLFDVIVELKLSFSALLTFSSRFRSHFMSNCVAITTQLMHSFECDWIASELALIAVELRRTMWEEKNL